MGITIRQATPRDVAAACTVLRRSIAECCTRDHCHDAAILDAWLGNKTPENVGNWFATTTNYSVVAERDGLVQGVALLTQAGKLSLCYVLPEALYTGMGKALLAEIEAQARRWGIGVLKLHSTATASAFYARNGFVSAGKEKSSYGVECDFYWKKLSEAPGAGAAAPPAAGRFCTCSGK